MALATNSMMSGLKSAFKPTEKEPKIGQDVAAYEGPESGPFRCGNCEYFQGPSACQKVMGKIDPGGCCNQFEKGGAEPGETEEEDTDASSESTEPSKGM